MNAVIVHGSARRGLTHIRHRLLGQPDIVGFLLGGGADGDGEHEGEQEESSLHLTVDRNASAKRNDRLK